MQKLYFITYFVIIVIFVTKSYALSSSSYLIANSAILFYDYEKANSYFSIKNLDNFHINDLEKKLVTFVNSNSFVSATHVAQKILEKDQKNQEAWIVYLLDAKINGDKEKFNTFINKNKSEKLVLVDFIFYNGSLLKNNIDIAKSLLQVVQNSISTNNIEFQNYDYFLFYLSLSLVLHNSFNEANFYLAQIYQSINNYQKAEKFYNKIENNSDLYLEGKINIANNKSKKKNIEGAKQDLELLINENPKNIRLLLAMGDLLRTSKEYKIAIKYYSKIINQKDIDPEILSRILYLRGICYERINNWSSAEDDFLSSLDIDYNSPQVLNYLAYGWIERNLFIDKSLRMLEIAHEQYPESYYILDSLAWAHFKKNNLKLASELMEKVLFMEPGEAISIDHLGDIYFKMGRKREAYFMWKQALDLAEQEDNIIEDVKKKIEMYNAG